MCLSAPGMMQHKQYCESDVNNVVYPFLVQPGRGPGIEMCLSAPGLYNTNRNKGHEALV